MLDDPKTPPAEPSRAEPPGDDGTPSAGHGEADAAREGKHGNSKDGEAKDAKPLPRWPFVLTGLVVAAFAFGVLFYVFQPRPDVYTDDAFTTAHYSTVAPRVAGQVAGVAVNDNQPVKAGQVLVTLDPRDLETALASAEAALARDQAQVVNQNANIARQPALITEQVAAIASARAKLTLSQADARRFTNLAATGAGSTQERQQSASVLQQNEAAVASAEASLDATRRQLDVLTAQKSSSEGTVALDKAQVAQAKLNLSYGRIVAPVDGTVGERSVDVGNYVTPGTTLMTIVPLDEVYVEANYREVDLRHVRTGQAATIHVDAYDIDLAGVVDSLPPASGAAFAPIAPNNATGNFTKIVQRLPVKIVVSPGQPLAKLLRVGFSVETTIHTGFADVIGEQRRSPARATKDP